MAPRPVDIFESPNSNVVYLRHHDEIESLVDMAVNEMPHMAQAVLFYKGHDGRVYGMTAHTDIARLIALLEILKVDLCAQLLKDGG